MEPKRDISEIGSLDQEAILYLWHKISAAGEMKTAIKRFLSDWDKYEGRPGAVDKTVKDLRKAMENYLNVPDYKK